MQNVATKSKRREYQIQYSVYSVGISSFVQLFCFSVSQILANAFISTEAVAGLQLLYL